MPLMRERVSESDSRGGGTGPGCSKKRTRGEGRTGGVGCGWAGVWGMQGALGEPVRTRGAASRRESPDGQDSAELAFLSRWVGARSTPSRQCNHSPRITRRPISAPEHSTAPRRRGPNHDRSSPPRKMTPSILLLPVLDYLAVVSEIYPLCWPPEYTPPLTRPIAV